LCKRSSIFLCQSSPTCARSPKFSLHFFRDSLLGLALIDRSLERGYRPGIVLIDSGYGNNTTFLLELEKRKLKYIGGIAKNRKVIIAPEGRAIEEIRLDNLAKSLSSQAFTPLQLNLENKKPVWVASIEVELSSLEGKRTIAIVMNASTLYHKF